MNSFDVAKLLLAVVGAGTVLSVYLTIRIFRRQPMNIWERIKPPAPMALPMRGFGCDDPNAYDWSDWERDTRIAYPFRFWLTHTFPQFFWPMRRVIRDAWYWLQCHTLRSYRFHLLDIRKPGPGIDYTHGWLDRDTVILYAAFTCLRQFVEIEKPVDPTLCDDGNDWSEHKKRHDEVMALYDWWMRGRLEDIAAEERAWAIHEKDHRDEGTRRVWIDARQFVEDREQEMLERLIKVRRYMWT